MLSEGLQSPWPGLTLRYHDKRRRRTRGSYARNHRTRTGPSLPLPPPRAHAPSRGLVAAERLGGPSPSFGHESLRVRAMAAPSPRRGVPKIPVGIQERTLSDACLHTRDGDIACAFLFVPAGRGLWADRSECCHRRQCAAGFLIAGASAAGSKLP